MSDRRLRRSERRPPWGPGRLALLLLGAVVIILLSSCPEPILTARLALEYHGRSVTYHGNGSTGGSVPTDANYYMEGATVTVLDNTGGLTRDGYPFFIGWNTEPDGSGTTYRPAETCPMPGSDLTLYALWVDLEKILASDGAAGDWFGMSVAISGDYAIVGASHDDDKGTDSGSAYIFHRTGINTWDAGTRILASDGAADDGFGDAVAISGDYAIVGAFLDDDKGDASGSAWIFHRTGTNTWDAGTKILADDGAPVDWFGRAVAISGDYAIVGVRYDDDIFDSTGSAWVYHRTGTNTWDTGTKILASDGALSDRFGWSVAISGDYAIVAAVLDDDKGTDSGSAWVFHRTGTNTWDAGTKILASDGAADDCFGTSVTISGDYAIVGATQDDDKGTDSGSAWVFHRTGTNTWDAGTKITAIDGAAGDRFGISVAISGDYAIVGAYLDDDKGTDSGSAWVFHRTGTNTWDTATKITPADGAAGDYFSVYIAISGEHAIIAAVYDDDNGTDSGSVYVQLYR